MSPLIPRPTRVRKPIQWGRRGRNQTQVTPRRKLPTKLTHRRSPPNPTTTNPGMIHNPISDHWLKLLNQGQRERPTKTPHKPIATSAQIIIRCPKSPEDAKRKFTPMPSPSPTSKPGLTAQVESDRPGVGVCRAFSQDCPQLAPANRVTIDKIIHNRQYSAWGKRPAK